MNLSILDKMVWLLLGSTISVNEVLSNAENYIMLVGDPEGLLSAAGHNKVIFGKGGFCSCNDGWSGEACDQITCGRNFTSSVSNSYMLLNYTFPDSVSRVGTELTFFCLW